MIFAWLIAIVALGWWLHLLQGYIDRKFDRLIKAIESRAEPRDADEAIMNGLTALLEEADRLKRRVVP
jgi:hypothetical protein